jgi:hypothetical protein
VVFLKFNQKGHYIYSLIELVVHLGKSKHSVLANGAFGTFILEELEFI